MSETLIMKIAYCYSGLRASQNGTRRNWIYKPVPEPYYSNSLPIPDEKIIISRFQQPAEKFDNANERHLLTVMLSNPCYYSQVGKERFFKRGSVDFNRLYECAWVVNVDEKLNLDADGRYVLNFLHTLDWNVKFLSENDEERDIEYIGFCTSSKHVKPKGLAHMKDELVCRSVLAEEDLLEAESEKAARNIARMGTVPKGRLTEFPKIYPIDTNERAAVTFAAPPSLPNMRLKHSISQRSREKETVRQPLALLRGNSVVSAKTRLGIAHL